MDIINQLVTQLPIYFKLELNESIVTAILQNKAVNLVGMRGSGKKVHLKFLVSHITEYTNKLPDTKLLILDGQKPDSIPQHSQDTIIAFSNIDTISDEDLLSLLSKVDTLRTDQSFKGYIFLSSRPLTERVTDIHIQSRLLTRTLYYTPLTASDLIKEIEIHSKHLSKKINTQESLQIAALSGGHPRLLKELVAIDSLEDKQQLIKKTEMVLKEIASSLTKAEIEELKTIASEDISSLKSDYLLDAGFVERDSIGSKFSVFSSLFGTWIKGMSLN